MDIIKVSSGRKIQKYNLLTAAQLKVLVPLAQKHDQQAIDTLCEAFKPLIYREATKPFIRDILGEDAVNTAWVIFLSLINSYKGDKFSQLPGLLSLHIRHRLCRIVARHKKQSSEYDSYDIALEDGDFMQIADKKDYIAQSDVQLLLKKALDSLPKTQKLVIEALYFRGVTPKHCSVYGISKQACSIHKARAFKKLRDLIPE